MLRASIPHGVLLAWNPLRPCIARNVDQVDGRVQPAMLRCVGHSQGCKMPAEKVIPTEAHDAATIFERRGHRFSLRHCCGPGQGCAASVPQREREEAR